MKHDVASVLVISTQATQTYARNQLLVQAFQNIGQVETLVFPRQNVLKRIFKFFSSTKKWRSFKTILIIYPAQFLALESWLLKCFGKKIIMDLFISQYDSNVSDRKLYRTLSLRAFYSYWQDWISCHLGSILLFDTNLHQTYFEKTFRIPRSKKKQVIPIPIDHHFFKPGSNNSESLPGFQKDKINLLFYGFYIPLQGIETIIETAYLLKDHSEFHFILIGSGQTYASSQQKIKQLELRNVTTLPRLSHQELLPYIQACSIGLGIFGTTPKAYRVIPNKVLECLACEKLVITGKTPAIQASFEDGKEILLCPPGNPEQLAEKIKWAAGQGSHLKSIGSQARQKIIENFSLESIQSKLGQLLPL